MNKALFKANIKSNWGIFVFIFGMLMIYVLTSITMFDPESSASMAAMMEMLPEGMAKAFGFDKLGTEITTYLAGYLFGFILLVFPLIYTVIVANSLVVKHVDNGSMAYLLATPNSRVKVMLTQVSYMVISVLLLMGGQLLVQIILCEMLFPGQLEIGQYVGLNWVTFLVILTTASISFLASSIFNESRQALAVGAGVPMIFVVSKMVSGASEGLEYFKYFTLYSVIDIDKILSEPSYVLLISIILIAVSSFIYTLSIMIFNKRSLAL